MNYIKLSQLVNWSYDPLKVKSFFKGVPSFAVGVRNSPESSLENFLATFPNVRVVQKFPETPNSKYTKNPRSARESHMLQPVILEWID